MALQKQPITVNFSQGLDTKSDPKQVQVGKFLALQNSVFDKQGALTKRNGFGNITTLPNALQTTLTTLNGSLLATGSSLYAYSPDTANWLNQGTIQPVSINVTSILRNSTSQTAPDAAVTSSGLALVVYVDNSQAYYQVSDSATGQQVVSRQALPATATNPRTFVLGQFFIVTFVATVGGTPHLQFVSIPFNNPSNPSSAVDISTSVSSLTAGYDGVVANNNLYLAWSGTGSAVKLAYLTSSLVVSAQVSIASHSATAMSVAADTSTATPTIWATFYNSGDNSIYTAAYSANLVQLLAPALVDTVAVATITSVAASGVLKVVYDVNQNYGFSGGVRSDYIKTNTVTVAGVVGTPATPIRSVGLGSKAFVGSDGNTYVLVVYSGKNQPTYFLIDTAGNIYARLAYSNAGGYASSQVLPTVTAVGTSYLVPYLLKDFLTTVNKGTNNPANTPVNAIYTQTGINMLKFSINTAGQYSSEIANALHLTGGQLWEYDGVKPVEHGFHVYPEDIAIATATSGGNIGAGTYYYVFTYEWTDNQGLLHRSAPSIPISQVTTGTTSANTLYVPTLRLTSKLSPNPIRIVGYRWSVTQQVYYQFTSVTTPVSNDPTVDYVTIVDTLADSAILGQTLLYTTGGVIENIAAPASTASVLFKNRLFLIDAEDPNLLWYSKQVIEGVPVEMSDLLTLYVAPSTGTQGSTGPALALGALDDKLIIFKRNAIYYVTGNGPDNTGANNDFSDPIFITASVGCANPNSIVLMPNGLMFQSDKGIWLLGRDLSTQYIGAPVEAFNSNTVLSATTIPGTNQVRFILDSGTTLMYDFFYSQWGTFTNVSAISATLFNDLHTYLNKYGQVFQETPGSYLDGSSPVLMSFKTSWISLAGLQGYERFYFLYLLGTYYTPFKLNVGLGYDFNDYVSQSVLVTPDNYTPNWGGDALWGSGKTWGGASKVFEARIFPQIQKCESFQLTISETFDPSLGIGAGQGLSLSGLNLIIGAKKGYRVQKAGRSFG